MRLHGSIQAVGMRRRTEAVVRHWLSDNNLRAADAIEVLATMLVNTEMVELLRAKFPMLTFPSPADIRLAFQEADDHGR